MQDSPVDGDGHKCQDADGDSTRGDEHGELAVADFEPPVLVEVEEEVEGRVEQRDHDVSHSQVDQEVVGDRAHALVGQNDPDDNNVASSGHDKHGDEDDVEDELLPPREVNELVGCHGGVGVVVL